MRKHRLFGVVIAVVIGLGVFTHRSSTPHRTPGTGRAGIQLASAELPANDVAASVHRTAATETSYQSRNELLRLGSADFVGMPSTPVGPQAPVWDFRFALSHERVAANAYLAARGHAQAQAQAYLHAVAQQRAAEAYLVAVAQQRAAEAYLVAVAQQRAAEAAAPLHVSYDTWAELRQCESGGSYSADTGNGYYGAYQFNPGTWASLGFRGLPSQAPPAQQDQAAQELQARRGWSQWPSCARRLGLT